MIKKRNDKASTSRRGSQTNWRAATPVNVVAASSTPSNQYSGQLELFPGRASPLMVKSAMRRNETVANPPRWDGVKDGGTPRTSLEITGETQLNLDYSSREAYKGNRNRRPDVELGVGGGHSTEEGGDNPLEGRATTSSTRARPGKTTGLLPRGSASSRSKSGRQPPARMDPVRKWQRSLYRTAQSQPQRQFPQLYDKVCRIDILNEAWRRIKANRGAAGVDQLEIADVLGYGESQFIEDLRTALVNQTYRVSPIRRVQIPKPGSAGATRSLGIPTLADRVVQMAVKIVIEPLFEADFLPVSYGFRPKRSPRLALSAVIQAIRAGFHYVIEVDLQQYFDTIDHEKLMNLVKRRVTDIQVLRLIRAWLKAGVMTEGAISHPLRGTPQGGVISPLLANLYLHEIDRQWYPTSASVQLVRYADDIILLTRTLPQAQTVEKALRQQCTQLKLTLNEAKSQVTTVTQGFSFLGFEYRQRHQRLYLWPKRPAIQHLLTRVRQVVRSVRHSQQLKVVIKALNPVLIGWCTYFRVGHSNRVFHWVDWQVREQIYLWLRRKYQIAWSCARKRWDYRQLHERQRLYRLVGKVSYLEGL